MRCGTVMTPTVDRRAVRRDGATGLPLWYCAVTGPGPQPCKPMRPVCRDYIAAPPRVRVLSFIDTAGRDLDDLRHGGVLKLDTGGITSVL